MTQKTTLPGVFAGPGVSDLPLFVADFPVLSKLVHRYSVASLAAAAVGSAVASLPDLTGLSPSLAASAPANRPTLMAETGRRFIRFDGTDDALTAAGNGITGPKTFAVVARFREDRSPAGNWPVLSLRTPGPNGALSLSTNGQIAGYSTKTTGSTFVPGTGWHVFLMVFNGDSSVVRMDAAETTATTGDLPTSVVVGVGPNTGSGPNVPLDVAEIMVWDQALKLSDRNAAVAALAKEYNL